MAERLLYTPVEAQPGAVQIDAASRLVMLGSCFAQEVGSRMEQQMPEGSVLTNPLGPMYSPMAISETLRSWMRGEAAREPFLGHDGRWHSWQASSVCSADSQESCTQLLTTAWQHGREALKSATHLIVTFGTTRYYRLLSPTGSATHPVANCHKEPAARFSEIEPTLEALIADWQALTDELHAFNPSLRILLTVSPYRYRKYGFHASQIQKSKLLLLCDALCSRPDAPQISYFPSYEILLDELRDYRFYATDMLHPSEQAVDIITERFREWAFTPAMLREADERLREYRRAQHRPII